MTQPSIPSKPSCVPRWLLLALSLMPVLAFSQVPIDMDEALGGAGLTWVTGGSVPWASNEMVFDAGTESAASGIVLNNQSSWLETTVTGPGQIFFRWAMASEPFFDELLFQVGETTVLKRSGLIPWTFHKETVSQAGEVALRWTYTKDESVDYSRDQAYLDQVLWVPQGSGGLFVRREGNGSGAVVSSDSGATIDCGPRCIATSGLLSTITLEATADSGSVFEGWSGACSGTQATCQVTVEAESEVVALFSKVAWPEALNNGDTLTGFSGRALSASHFYIDVPAGASDLVIRLKEVTPTVKTARAEDPRALIRVAAGRRPTSLDYDCAPWVSEVEQICAFASPSESPYHIAVADLSDEFLGLELQVSYAMAETSHGINVSTTNGGRVVSSNVVFLIEKVEEPIYSTQVVGGRDTTIEQWPWQVQLRKGDLAFCGGSLISPNWVVTAAHCLDEGEPTSVYLGREQLHSGGSIQSVSEVIIHEDYKRTGFNHDIALIRLGSAVSFGPSIQPIELLSAEQEPNLAEDGVLASVTGWGWRYPTIENQPDVLQAVDVAMVSTEACRNSGYSASSITDNMICAGFVEGGVDACAGDSGGPLVVRDRLGGYRLAGITSWGQDCALPDYPGVYTRVSKFVSWVEDKTGLSFPDTILDCGERCQVTVPNETKLTLVPQPEPGYFFVGFDGVCAGEMTCRLEVDDSQSIQAQFAPIPIFQDRFESQ